MRLELSPQQGNRNAEICPKLEAMDPAVPKWIQILLKANGHIPELRSQPKQSPYRLHPITRTTPRERLRKKTQKEEPTTKQDGAIEELPKQDHLTPKRQQKEMPTTKNQTPDLDFLNVPKRGTVWRKTARGEKFRLRTPQLTTKPPTWNRWNPDGGNRHARQISPMGKNHTAILHP